MNGPNDCRLLVGGREFGGWKEIDVERSIESIAGCYRLEVTAHWPGEDAPVGLREGLPCEVYLGEDLVITGHIDEYEPDLTEHSTRICVQGRDKTADLVDCSAIHKTGSWHGVKLEQIVSDIAAPFGIAVVVDEDVSTGDVFKSFALEDGERAFDAIDRACRLRAVLCTSTVDGKLLLTVASDEQAGVSLIEGVNIKRIHAVHTWKDRYSKVILKAQSPGDDDQSGGAVAHLKAEATDEEINRYRPLIVMAEHHTSSKSLKDRAGWEVRVRMGRGKRGSVTVVGWRTGGKDGQEGPLWRPNTTVRIVSARMNLDRDMLIVACNYQLTEEGRKAIITFARPEAFELVEGVSRGRGLGRRLGNRIGDQQRRHKRHSDGYTQPWDLDPAEEIRR